MIKNLQIEWWVSFAAGPFGGNPAPIVVNDHLEVSEMQGIAAELGFETVFIGSPSEGGQCRLRFFVPQYEVDMCGHGTIAALTFLRVRGLIPRSGVAETASGPRLFCEGRHGMMLRLGRLERSDSVPSLDEIADALQISQSQVGGELGRAATVSVGRSNTIIPLVAEATLDSLTPDLEKLWALCRRHGATGVYVCAPPRTGTADAAARGFPLDVGYSEDPATGTAAGALVAELSSRGIAPADGQRGALFRIVQGQGIGRPSLIYVRPPDARDPHTWIGGRAEAVDRASVKPLS